MTLFVLFTLVTICCTPIHSTAQVTSNVGDPLQNEHGYACSADGSGNMYVGGKQGSDGILFRMNPSGAMDWSVRFEYLTGTSFTHEVTFIDVLADTLFGCGFINSGSNVVGNFTFKMDKNTGNFYWSHYDNSSAIYYSAMRYYEGNYYLCGTIRSNSSSNYDGKLVCVSSSNGNILWQSQGWGNLFPSSGIDYVDDQVAMTDIQNGRMFITGRSYTNGASSLDMMPFLIGLDISGNIILSKYLLYADNDPGVDRFYGMGIQFDGADTLVVSFFGDDNCTAGCDSYVTGLCKLDVNGNMIWAKTYDLPTAREFNRGVSVTNDGYVIFGGGNYSATNSTIFAIKVQKNGQFVTATQIANPTGGLNVNLGLLNLGGSQKFINSTHYYVGSTHNGNVNLRDIICIKLDENLNSTSACHTFTNISATVLNIPPFSGNLNTTPKPTNALQSGSLVSQTLTFTNPGCDSANVNYTLSSTPCVSTTVTISFNGTPYDITWPNGSTSNSATFTSDSTVIIEFTNPAACCMLYDTLDVFIESQSPQIALPADTLVCSTAPFSFEIIPTITDCAGCVPLWNSATTSPTFFATTDGTYIAEITNNCNLSASDTIEIQFALSPVIAPVQDTLVCSGTFPLQMSTSAQNADYIYWSNGIYNDTTLLASAGNYYVLANNSCGVDTAYFSVSLLPLPTIAPLSDIDTCIALGQEVIIPFILTDATSLTVNGVGYSGSDLTALSDTNFTLIATNTCGQVQEEFTVDMNYWPAYDEPYGIDTCLTEGTNVDISVSTNYGDLLWWNGSSAPVQTVQSSGTYYFAVSSECGMVSDSIVVDLDSAPSNSIFQPIDTCLAAGATLTIDPLSNWDVFWVPGGNAPLEIENSGVYFAEIVSACGNFLDSLVVEINTEPYLNFDDSVFVCGYRTTLNSLGLSSNYPFTLSTESGEPITHYITESGDYFVHLDAGSCGTIDQQFYIELGQEDLFYAPNSFSPDGDEFNNLYQFKGVDYTLVSVEIYNRWGERVYEEYYTFSGWDGTFKGRKAPSGTYVVKVVYLSCDQIEHVLHLHVNLIR